MSAKHMISPGIGFSPGSVRYIVTRGLIGITVVHPQLDFDLGVNRSSAFDLGINQSTAFDLGIQRVVVFDAEVG